MKKILIITKDFPPYSGSGNVLRILKFSKYLPEFGWQPYIICEKTSQNVDDTLLKELSDEIKIYAIESNSPLDKKRKLKNESNNSSFKKIKYYFHRIFIHNILMLYADNFIAPDKNKFWALSLLPKALEVIKKEKIDVLMVSGPSFASFYAGLKIKEKINIQLVLDIRDGWIGNEYFTENKKFFINRINKKIEAKSIELADLVISVTEPLIDIYKNRYPNYKDKICLITNGFDAEDFKQIDKNENNNATNKLNFVYSGTISGVRTPKEFFDALEKVVQEDKTLLNIINIYFYGKFNYQIKNKYEYLKPLIHIMGHTPHSNILNKISFADVFIFLSRPSLGGKTVMTGKTFEYVAFNKPILIISDKNAATELIEDLGLGYYANYDDVNSIKEEIIKIVNDWKSNKLKKNDNLKKLEQFERKNLTKELSIKLNEIQN